MGRNLIDNKHKPLNFSLVPNSRGGRYSEVITSFGYSHQPIPLNAHRAGSFSLLITAAIIAYKDFAAKHGVTGKTMYGLGVNGGQRSLGWKAKVQY